MNDSVSMQTIERFRLFNFVFRSSKKPWQLLSSVRLGFKNNKTSLAAGLPHTHTCYIRLRLARWHQFRLGLMDYRSNKFHILRATHVCTCNFPLPETHTGESNIRTA